MKSYEKEQKMNAAGDLVKELQEIDKLSQNINRAEGREGITKIWQPLLTLFCCF